MHALILGYGRSGRAAERLAQALGWQTRVLDGTASFDEEFPSDIAIVSPGIALTHPWQSACRARGIPVKSELQFGCEELKRRGWKLVAVTGSKGKSSVVKLLAEALDGVPCGNYGLPVCEVALEARRGWAVVEVSSFQLETTSLPNDTFEAATVLNLQEDHLDRHGSVSVYHGLKRGLLKMAKTAVEEGADSALARGSYFDNEILRENAGKAIAVLRAVGLSNETIATAFARFRPLPHRFETVGTFGGVRCVDDSKATSLAALSAGVRMAGAGVRLIAGGLPKGDDPESVVEVLTRLVKKVYLIGQSAQAFSDAWRSAVNCEICGELSVAVEKALGEASAGETVLLSPGTASFDQFKSYGERGEVFASLVNKEGQCK